MPRTANVLADVSACRPSPCSPVAPAETVEFPAADVVNFQGLVSVHWLKRLLEHAASEGRSPPPGAWSGGRHRVVEAYWGGAGTEGAERGACVPGAILLDTDDLETPGPQWRLRSDAELQSTLGRLGIAPDTTVIVYGGDKTAAARAWWVLRYAGVRDVRLLDGGIAAWTRAGYAVQPCPDAPAEVEFVATVDHAVLASTAYLRARLGHPDVWFADVRSRAEYEGFDSGYDYIDAAGRLPGALHVDDADDSTRLYVRPDGHLRAPREILALWRGRGLTPALGGRRFAREVVFYCGTGWRSSLAFFYAWLLGLENIRNYSDGWSGWSTGYHEDAGAPGGWRQLPTGNPVERGRA